MIADLETMIAHEEGVGRGGQVRLPTKDGWVELLGKGRERKRHSWLSYLQGPVQNENVGLFIQNSRTKVPLKTHSIKLSLFFRVFSLESSLYLFTCYLISF